MQSVEWRCPECRALHGVVVRGKLQLDCTGVRPSPVVRVQIARGGTAELYCRCGGISVWVPRLRPYGVQYG